ncbi:MAG TPA: hypothetical protein VN025_17535 [Candidatus Dormibacteraeota bacterium]|jgi:hypothetical protein|nr:hypothetical protein [Candidatus Dormibacteraeota bacterium]
MLRQTLRLSVFSLLLAILFLAAQFHQCADLSANSSSSHVCPVCSVAGTIVTPESPVIAFVSTEARFVGEPAPRVVSSHIPYAASPRASPFA